MREIPRPQHYLLGDPEYLEITVESVELWLPDIVSRININPDIVSSFASLGCGYGAEILAALRIFPNAKIIGIDYHNLLSEEIRLNSRVHFSQGLLVEKLPHLDSPDITLLNHIGIDHNLNKENIGLLATFTGRGILITSGDNGGIESTEFFQNFFELIFEKGVPFNLNHFAAWKVKVDSTGTTWPGRSGN